MIAKVCNAAPLDALAAACAAQGIIGPGDFRARYGIAPAEVTVSAALALVTLPDWVFDVWLPNAGQRGVVAYIPTAVAAYGRIIGVVPQEGETPHDYNERLRARWQERMAQ